MSRTPYQTYLAERLQSARGLGWEVTAEGADAAWAKRSTPDMAAVRWARCALPNLLRWLGFAR